MAFPLGGVVSQHTENALHTRCRDLVRQSLQIPGSTGGEGHPVRIAHPRRPYRALISSLSTNRPPAASARLPRWRLVHPAPNRVVPRSSPGLHSLGLRLLLFVGRAQGDPGATRLDRVPLTGSKDPFASTSTRPPSANYSGSVAMSRSSSPKNCARRWPISDAGSATCIPRFFLGCECATRGYSEGSESVATRPRSRGGAQSRSARRRRPAQYAWSA